MAQPSQAELYWQRTRGLMWTALIVWFIFGFVVHIFAGQLNQIVVLGFPLGFYMAAQGSLIVFVALIFWWANRQNEVDEETGVAEDD